ncbi:STAS domain-containing protein [Spongiactinospora gelatinilytica]|uniref:STAS domain-containing protein n=1 Tax=Spongiactinospora gelatinilytica TaxID=2666298 RepID=UPI001314B038|nr:STAS domain-containing protein [Spongiactinospora gelatinilytica]
MSARRVLFDDGRLCVVVDGDAVSGAPTLALSGEIDRNNSDRLGAILAEARVTARMGDDVVVVDLAEVSFVDLSGLRVLDLLPGVRQQRALRVLNTPPFVRRLLVLLTPGGCDEGGLSG